MKRLWKITRFILIILIGLEIFLHFYNPFAGRVRNGEIILPKNTKYEVDLPEVKGLDQHLIHSKNSLGFRGDELKDTSLTRIICMGGSTTECFYLSDGKDWPNVLGRKLNELYPGYWINNAGMDGQSSFGNLQMLKQYILKLNPDYIILMCGLNDMSLEEPSKFDSYSQNWFQKVYNFLELPAAIRNIIRAGKAKKSGLKHDFFQDISKADTQILSDSQILTRLKEEQKFIPSYRTRIKEFIDICKTNKIKVILVAQSILFSDENDLFTNVNLGHLKTGTINGSTRSFILKMYNKTTFDVAEETGIPFINLSARLPKDSRFFYDGYHFTVDGAEMAAGILFDEINTRQLITLKPKE